MNVLIVGCGREGSELARSIAAQGHAVTIVDAEELAGAMTEQLASLFEEESTHGRGGGLRRAS